MKKSTRNSEWRQEFYDALKSKGFSSVIDFLIAYPTISYAHLPHVLAFDKNNEDSYYELLVLIDEEAHKNNAKLFIIQDALVRILHQYNVNWFRKTKSIEHRTGVYALWTSFVESCHKNISPYEIQKKTKAVWDYIEEQVPPNYDWLPCSTDDPIISDAFEKKWPYDN